MIDKNSQFMAILTAVGEAKQANADALGIPWTFSKMGVGDANGTDPIPSRTQTKLINERNRAPLNQVKVDPKNTNVVIAEQVIPENVGGWWIREIGLYDADGDLVAVANCAPSFKPLLAQGSGKTQVVRMNFIVTSAANVTLKIDPSVVLATRAYVDGLTVRASQVEAEDGTENSKIMTPFRVFQAIAKVVGQATEAAFGWAKVSTPVQVATGTDDTTIITPKKLRGAQATQVEAEAGSDNSKIMTPLRVFQSIAKVVGQATETAFGWAKVSTPVQVATGTDDTTIITPKKLRGAQATQVEAEAGSDNSKIMTPLRVLQSIAKVVGQATEVTFGWAKVASQPLVDAGLDDAAFLTSKKLRTAYGVGSSTYLDNLDTANVGFYYSIAAAVGAPPGVTGILHGNTRGSDGTTTKIQTCTDVSSGKTYHRVLKGSAHPWSAWVELAVADGQLGNSSQSWQDLTSSRAVNVNYTNSTGKPIFIAGRTASPAGVNGYVVVDGVNVVRLSLSSAQAVSDSWSVIVQPGSTYRTTGATSVQNWAELR